MATTATPVIQELPTMNETFVRVVFQPKDKVDAEGKTYTPDAIIYSNEEDAAKAEKDGEGHVIFAQSFSYKKANTDAGVAEIVPSERERCKLFNNGVSTKAQNRAKSVLLSKDDNGNYDFEQVPVYSLDEYVAKETASRGATLFNKIADSIASGKLTPEQVEAIKAMLG